MRTAPAVKASLWLAAGIFIGNRWLAFNPLVGLSITFLLLIFCLLLKQRNFGNVLISLALIGLGLSLTVCDKRDHALSSRIFGQPRLIGLRILDSVLQSHERQVFLANIEWTADSSERRVPGDGQLRLITQSQAKLAAGSKIIAFGEIQSYPNQRNPGGRDWRAEFERQGVMGWIKPDTFIVSQVGKPGVAWQARRLLGRTLRDFLPPRQADLLSGMVLGDKQLIPEELNDYFKQSGLYHLLVVSGANIGYLTGALLLLLSPLALPLRWRRIAAGLGVWAYVFLTGFAAPTVRAALMITIFLASFEIQRAPRLWNAWGVAAFLILLFQPQQLFMPGFQLSFAAMAGVLFASQVSRESRPNQPDLPLKSRRLVRWYEHYLKLPFLASLFAVLFTAPILVYHFGAFAPSAILTNLLAVPLSGAIFALSWLLLALKLLLGISIPWLNSGLELGLKGLEFLAVAGSGFPGNAGGFYGNFALITCICSTLVGLFLFKPKAKQLCWMLIGLAVFLAFFLTARSPYLQIEQLDVGQGDALLLRFPDGKNMMIDCGSQDAAVNELLPSLCRRGIHRLDAVAITHFDKDHGGGFLELIKSLQVLRLMTNSLEPKDDLGRSIIDAAQQRKIPIRELCLGDTVALSPFARCLTLWPISAAAGDDNAASLVLRISYGDCDLLLTGDIGATEESQLLAAGDYLQSEFLKVAHHGSAKSSSRPFLEQVHADYALVNCGAHNPYGHPNRRVLEDLHQFNCTVHRTDLSGAGVWRSDGKSVWAVSWR